MSLKNVETIETVQKVNNPDGTQTEIRVAERRLKKAHDKMMGRMQRRAARAEAEQLATAAQASAETPETTAESPKADRRRKKSAEPAASPESETPAGNSETGDARVE